MALRGWSQSRRVWVAGLMGSGSEGKSSVQYMQLRRCCLQGVFGAVSEPRAVCDHKQTTVSAAFVASTTSTASNASTTSTASTTASTAASDACCCC